MTIAELESKCRLVSKKLTDNEYIRDIISDVDANTFILHSNANEQLFEQGRNALGVEIASYAPYRPYTIEQKKKKGQPYDRVTLRDTGAFEKSFAIKIGRNEFYIDSDDWKTEKLVKKYGEEIFGLTDENLNELKEKIILPDLILHIKNDLK